jgi:hypothetical protein
MIDNLGWWILGLLLAIELLSWLVYGRTAGWWNPIRRVIWARIHNSLSKYGGYSLSHVTERQFVGAIKSSESELESILFRMGFIRNPWAALKRRLNRQDVSEGSFVWRNSKTWYIPDWLAHYQLHVTIFERKGGAGYDVYAHWELNYWRHPGGHLDGVNFSSSKGVSRMRNKLRVAQISFDDTVDPAPVIEQESGIHK